MIKKLTKIQATIKVVDLIVRYRITPKDIAQEMEIAREYVKEFRKNKKK